MKITAKMTVILDGPDDEVCGGFRELGEVEFRSISCGVLKVWGVLVAMDLGFCVRVDGWRKRVFECLWEW